MRCELVLGLALELGLADEYGEHRRGGAQHVVGGDVGGALVGHSLAEVAQPLGEGRAQAVLVRAAVGRRNRVAVGVEEAVLVGDPAHRPLHRAVPVRLFVAAREHILCDAGLAVDGGLQIFLEAAREMERRLVRRVVGDQRLGAGPADLDAAEQVSLRAGHAEQPLRLEGRALAEDLLVRPEAHAGAAPVLDGAQVLELALRLSARKRHGVELLAARHFHLELLGERIDDRHAHPVQASARIVDLAVELAARVQRGHDDFQRRLGLEFGVRVDRNAAAIVAHRQESIGLQFHIDPGGMACHRFVHGIVDHLGEQVMQRLLVGAAHVHAGPAPHRLEAFEHLDVGGGIAVGGFGWLADGARHGLFSCSLLFGFSDVQFQRRRLLRFRSLRRSWWLANQLQACLGWLASLRLRAFGCVRPAEQVAQGPECWHGRSPSIASRVADATPHANRLRPCESTLSPTRVTWHGTAELASRAEPQGVQPSGRSLRPRTTTAPANSQSRDPRRRTLELPSRQGTSYEVDLAQRSSPCAA